MIRMSRYDHSPSSRRAVLRIAWSIISMTSYTLKNFVDTLIWIVTFLGTWRAFSSLARLQRQPLFERLALSSTVER